MANKKDNPRGGSFGGGDHPEMAADLLFSQKPGFELVQNCDLPPPVKIFAGHDKTIVSPVNNVYGMIPGQKDEDVGVEMAYERSPETGKLELLKALRLSQTRARESERKAAVLSKERDDLSNLFLQQSMQLFAYKQWVRMMEFHPSKLNKHHGKKELCPFAPNRSGNAPKVDDENKGEKGVTWIVAVAICVSIAGFGFYSFFSSNHH